MQPMLAGTAILKSGKYKGREVPFKVYINTSLSGLQAFAKNVRFEKAFTSDPAACKGTIKETIRILLRYPPLTERELELEGIGRLER